MVCVLSTSKYTQQTNLLQALKNRTCKVFGLRSNDTTPFQLPTQTQSHFIHRKISRTHRFPSLQLSFIL